MKEGSRFLLFHHSSQQGLTWSCDIPPYDSGPDSECRTVVLSVVVCPWCVPASRIGIHQQKFPTKNFWLKFPQTQNWNVSIKIVDFGSKRPIYLGIIVCITFVPIPYPVSVPQKTLPPRSFPSLPLSPRWWSWPSCLLSSVEHLWERSTCYWPGRWNRFFSLFFCGWSVWK